jgi:hypothetical protein
MRCKQCGAVVDDTGKTCPKCGYSVSTVEILTLEEREGFQGLTIETSGSGGARQDDYSNKYHEPQKGVFVREFNFNTGKGGAVGRILAGLLVAGVLFLAFPMLFIVLAVAIMGGLLSLALRRR